MQNLLRETVKALTENNKSAANVLWCGSPEFGFFTWNEFTLLADTYYDNGYGGQEVAKDLLIVGSDFWLERSEYDGAESWDFKTTPIKPANHVIPHALTCHQSHDHNNSWATLKELNEPENNND